MKKKLEGVIPAMITPFTKNGKKVDYDKVCGVANFLADQGIQGLFVGGTTGFGLLMSVEDRKRTLEEVIGAVGDRILIVAQTGALDTHTAIELTQHAQEAGADAAGVMVPGVYPLDSASLRTHYETIAKAVAPFPILLYNIPAFTTNALSPRLILELTNTAPNIVGLKDSSGNMSAFSHIAAHMPKGFILFNGADACTYLSYVAGGHGSVSGAANIAPELFLAIRKHFQQGNTKKALESQRKLGELVALIAIGPAFPIYFEAMRLRGCDTGHVRPPVRNLTAKEKKNLALGLERLGMV